MAQFFIKCSCGHQRRVTESSVGLSGRCPKCGQEMVVTEDALSPVEHDDNPFVAEKEARPPSPFSGGEDEPFEYQPADHRPKCARCGKPFRGEWDMRETDEGVLCNICANRAHEHTEGEGNPQPTAAQRAEIEAAIQENQEASVARQVAEERAKREEDARRIEKSFFGIPEEKMRRVALVGAGAVLLLCFYYAFLAPSAPPPPPATEVVAEVPAKELPAVVGYVVWGIGLAASLVAEFIALYMALRWAKKLPNNVFRYDLIAVGIATVVIWLVRLVPLAYIPLLGIVMIGVREIVLLYALHEVYRLDFSELVAYLVMHILIPLPISIMETFLLAGIAYAFL